jgi:hypothetical protein
VGQVRPRSRTEQSEAHARKLSGPITISTLSRVNGPLSVATIIVALVLAAWYLLRAALNRAPSRFDLLAVAVFSVLVAVLVVIAVVNVINGDRPSETSTFFGYLITTIAFAPVALYLARLEPTRWGNLILGVACLVLPVLVLRLQQIASVTGA